MSTDTLLTFAVVKQQLPDTGAHSEMQDFLFSLSTNSLQPYIAQEKTSLKILTSSSTKIHRKLDYTYDLPPNFINHRH